MSCIRTSNLPGLWDGTDFPGRTKPVHTALQGYLHSTVMWLLWSPRIGIFPQRPAAVSTTCVEEGLMDSERSNLAPSERVDYNLLPPPPPTALQILVSHLPADQALSHLSLLSVCYEVVCIMGSTSRQRPPVAG